MRKFLCTLLIVTVLPTLPALATAAQPRTARGRTLVPPPVSYEVWGFRWDGTQWVKQPNHSFTTNDLQQAANYVRLVNSYPGWCATSNIPAMPVARNRLPRVPFGYGGITIGGPWGDLINQAIAQAAQGGQLERIDDNADSSGVESNFQPADNGDSVRLQDQLNAIQNGVDEQNMLNTQNMIDTQNAINNQLMTDQINAAANQAMVQALSQ
jgi:hypothetical protein